MSIAEALRRVASGLDVAADDIRAGKGDALRIIELAADTLRELASTQE